MNQRVYRGVEPSQIAAHQGESLAMAQSSGKNPLSLVGEELTVGNPEFSREPPPRETEGFGLSESLCEPPPHETEGFGLPEPLREPESFSQLHK